MPQQEGKTSGVTHGERQTPCRGEIGERRIARQFGNDAGERAALEGFLSRPQHIDRTSDFQQQQMTHRQTEQFTARSIEVAAFASGMVGENP